jgi:hypothetical protein
MTHLVYLLDRSGSMQPFQESAVSAFNSFLRDQRDVPGEATLSLILFDDQYEPLHRALLLGQVPELTAAGFVPRGSTALLDAIGRTIKDTSASQETLPEEHRPEKVILAIFTDGYENASRHYTNAHISDLIAAKRVQGWEFLFLAANQDAIATAAAMNIHAGDTSAVGLNDQGIKTTGKSFSRKVRAIRKFSMTGPSLSPDELTDLHKPMSDIVQEESNKP